jgi:hypothetical protein
LTADLVEAIFMKTAISSQQHSSAGQSVSCSSLQPLHHPVIRRERAAVRVRIEAAISPLIKKDTSTDEAALHIPLTMVK